MRTVMLSLTAAGLFAACAPVQPQPSAPPEEGPTQCRADRHQNLIGRSRSEIPAPPAGETWRIACTTCAVTMDYNPRRLNFYYDEGTGAIRRVECG